MSTMSLTELSKQLAEEAIMLFGKQELDPLVYHMMIVSEIAEATEASRKNLDFYIDEKGKPEGEAVEMIDALIRILNYCGNKGWDVDHILNLKREYNRNRQWKKENKRC